jgi:CRP-like cAMP-binding protein
MTDLKSIITDHPFLRGMKREHLDILARHAREAEFAAGQDICRESQAAYEFYLILEGKVAVESYVPREEHIPLQVIGGGDVLGWSWLFPPFVWHFQARALEPTKAIFLDGASLLVACENNHDLGYELMRRIAQVVINRLQATRKVLLKLQPADEPWAAAEVARRLRGGTEIIRAKTLETRLAEHPFSQGVKPQHLKILTAAAMYTEFKSEELIFHEGDIANRFYLIERGKVALETARAEGDRVPVQIIGDGDALGWSWLFAPYYWHFDARALEATQTIFLYGTRLREECDQDHDFGYELMKRICRVLIHRLQATRRQLLAVQSRTCSGERRNIPAAVG